MDEDISNLRVDFNRRLNEHSDKVVELTKRMIDASQPRWQDSDLKEFLDKAVGQGGLGNGQVSRVMHKRLKDLPENVHINVNGSIIETKLKVLRKFDKSILADIFSGRTYTSVDENGYAIIDSDPESFQNMLKYIEEDRAWLPPNDQHAKRELVETEIRKWQVDCGLAKPSTLLTKAAIDFQTVLNNEPDVSLCDTKDALQAWQKLGPMKLS